MERSVHAYTIIYISVQTRDDFNNINGNKLLRYDKQQWRTKMYTLILIYTSCARCPMSVMRFTISVVRFVWIMCVDVIFLCA